MSNKKDFKPKKSTGTAVLKIKYLNERMNPEVDCFEDIITSSNSSIKVDFNDGVSLMEDNFKRLDGLMDKLYLEFYDNYKNVDFMDYLSNESSDFRVTTGDGVIVRLSNDDKTFLEMDQDNNQSGNSGHRIFKMLRKIIERK